MIRELIFPSILSYASQSGQSHRKGGKASLSEKHVVIIYVASANIAVNNRGQMVTVRKDGRGGSSAVAVEKRRKKRGKKRETEREREGEDEWRVMKRREKKEAKADTHDSYPRI